MVRFATAPALVEYASDTHLRKQPSAARKPHLPAVFQIHVYNAKKFPNRLFPAVVKIDSGWNCTPQIGKVLCRSPMISS